MSIPYNQTQKEKNTTETEQNHSSIIMTGVSYLTLQQGGEDKKTFSNIP